MKGGGAGYFELDFVEVRPTLCVGEVGFGVGEDLFEEGFAIGGDAGGSMVGFDLVEKWELEMVFEVPFEEFLFLL